MEEIATTEVGPRHSKRLIGSVAFVAALGGGALFGFALGSPTASSAQTPDTTTTAPDGTDDTTDHPRADCGPGFGASLDAAASALGITTDELATELRAGKTIADVAGEKGVDVQTVIDAMVADANARLDEAVAAGRITEDDAADKRADLEARITDLVNNGAPEHGPFGTD